MNCHRCTRILHCRVPVHSAFGAGPQGSCEVHQKTTSASRVHRVPRFVDEAAVKEDKKQEQGANVPGCVLLYFRLFSPNR